MYSNKTTSYKDNKQITKQTAVWPTGKYDRLKPGRLVTVYLS